MTRIERQYLRSAGSSHLKADQHHEDVDTIIAAGSSREGLAAALLRVRGEYDTVRGNTDQAARIAQQQEAEAKKLEERARVEVSKMNLGPTRAWLYRQEAQVIRASAKLDTINAHLMVMLHLKSLRAANLLLWNYTRQRAEETRMEVTPQELDFLTSKVMQAFLQPKCPHCGGRGFNGGHRQPTVHCTHCRQIGDMPIDWKGPEFELFGRDMLYRIEEKVERLHKHLLRRTRT